MTIVEIKGVYTDEQIQKAISVMNEHLTANNAGRITGYEIIKKDGVKTSDAPPCPDCGNTLFIRTGTCHVCQVCGASQGCS